MSIDLSISLKQKLQISQQQIQNLANNDLLPISEIAKKASEINNSEEVEIKLN